MSKTLPPLLDNPLSREYTITGPRSELTINVTAFPGQWILYEAVWSKKPPAGITAVCKAQVTLMRKAIGKVGDRVSSIRADSNDMLYAGQTNGKYKGQPLHWHQIIHVDDLELHGKIYESA